MTSIGLVLSAGGPLGDPWHAGVLGRLRERLGWDARTVALVVGTSAGSITAVTLRAGIDPADRLSHFRGEPLSSEAQAVYDRITTPYEEPTGPRDWRPNSPGMAWRAVWPPWRADPVRFALAALPRGTRSGAALEARMNELLPPPWPADPTWITAVRLSDGRRVVFGRDDVKGDIGQAVRASTAVPGVYSPARIGSREYVDGGVHSSTNADLAAMLGFDLVVVSSVMTATPDARSWASDPTRAWFSRKLDDEVVAVRHRGTPAMVIEPDRAALDVFRGTAPEARADAALAGAAAVDRVLDGPEGAGWCELLERAGTRV